MSQRRFQLAGVREGPVTDQHLNRAEAVPVGAARRRVGYPLPGHGLHQWLMAEGVTCSRAADASKVPSSITAAAAVGCHSAWRMTMPRPADLQNSHQNGGRVLSYSWRILKPCGCASCTAARLAWASRTPPAAYDAIGGLARRGEIGAETAFRDGYLRHDDLRNL